MKKLSDKTVTITLIPEEVSFLVAALHLGMKLEEWCAQATDSDLGTVDPYTYQWMKTVHVIRDKIFRQTKNPKMRFAEAEVGNVHALHQILLVEFKKWEKRRDAIKAFDIQFDE